MQRFSSGETEGINVICPISCSQLLSGHKNGAIRLWTLQENANNSLPIFQWELNADRKDNKAIIELVLLPSKNRFLAYHEAKLLEIWDLEFKMCVQSFGLDVYNYNCSVPLPGNLLAVGYDRSPAYGCFDVWDMENGERLLYDENENALVHRPHGIILAAVKGYLAFHSCCRCDLSIWKIGRTICEKTSEYDSDRIYSMTSTPEGYLITAGHHISLFSVSEEGRVQIVKKMDNWNVIDILIPLQAFSIVIVDRRMRRGFIRVRNGLIERISHNIGDSFIASGEPADVWPEQSDGHVNLPCTGLIVSIYKNEICVHNDAKINKIVPREIAQLRSYARIFGQSLRTKTGHFWRLTRTLLLQIIMDAFDNGMSEDNKEMVIECYLGKPTNLEENYGAWNSVEEYRITDD